jgi:hypothetical protein
MAGIRLEFAQFGDFDSFDIIRSTSSMANIADTDLPSPMVTGLKTMYWVDTNVIKGTTYYYKARVYRGNTSFVSNEITVIAVLQDPNYAKLSCALMMDSVTITDKTGRSTFANNGRTTLDTTNKLAGKNTVKFSSTSNFFDVYSNLNFGTGDFCIRCWVRLDAYPGGGGNNDMSIVDLMNGFLLYCNNATGEASMWDGTAGVGVSGGSAGILPLNTWCFIEASRTAGVFRLFLNGNLLGSVAYTRNLNSVGYARVAGSTYDSNTRAMRGNIARFSIYNGWGGHTASYTTPSEPEYLHYV